MNDDILYESIKNVLEEMVKAFEPAIEHIQHIYDKLEPYQRYEIMHPRKKPRGSIRRSKK